MSVTVFLDSDEITAEAYAITAQRGRSLETESFDAGSCSVVVRNYDANFNPYFLTDTSALLLESGDFLLLENGDKILLEFGNGTGSGTYGEILTGRKITIVDGSTTVFTGFVEDYDFTWTPRGFAEATLSCRDALATLGATKFLEWTTTEAQLTGARISSVLNRDEVSFPSGASFRDIDTGTQPLQSDLVSYGSSVLNYLQKVTETESGRLFVNRSGKLVFQDRYASFGIASSADFDDAGTNLPFHGVEVRFGTELLHFKVSVAREDGVTQTATNSGQMANYPTLGARHLTLGGMLFQSDDHALGLASFLLGRYSQIAAVISGLTINLHALSTSNRNTVAALDIGDVVTLSWTPPGTSGSVSQTLAIESVTYRSLFDGSTSVSFQLSDASDPGYFVLDTDALDGPAALAP